MSVGCLLPIFRLSLSLFVYDNRRWRDVFSSSCSRCCNRSSVFYDNVHLLEEVGALKAANAEELEALRIKYLSKKGAINDLMADFRNVAAEQKKEVGMKLNELKTKAQEKINALKEQFDNQDNGQDDLDLTRSAYPVELGTRHPLSIVRNEIIDIFARLGFNIAEGPEIEDDWHVFSALNFAEDHPARDMQDTFFIESHPDVLLRTMESGWRVPSSTG